MHSMKQIVFAALLCIIAAGLFAQKAGDTLYVNVQNADLRSSAGFFASTTGKVNYRDEVKALAVAGKWIQVQKSVDNETGWIASANLTARKVTQQGGANASASEMALAGKGFNEEIETEYKKGAGNMNYAAVDDMENATVANYALLQFIEEGHLAKGE